VFQPEEYMSWDQKAAVSAFGIIFVVLCTVLGAMFFLFTSYYSVKSCFWVGVSEVDRSIDLHTYIEIVFPSLRLILVILSHTQGVYDSSGQSFDKKYSTIDEVQAFVPQIRYDKLGTPLLACNLSYFDLVSRSGLSF
jgi:hypothetical protein